MGRSGWVGAVVCAVGCGGGGGEIAQTQASTDSTGAGSRTSENQTGDLDASSVGTAAQGSGSGSSSSTETTSGSDCGDTDCPIPGDSVWERRWTPATAGLVAAGRGVAVDSADSVVVVGWQGPPNAASDERNAVVLKYSVDGDLSWEEQPVTNSGHERALSVAIRGDDSIAVVGGLNILSNDVLWVALLGSGGQMQWEDYSNNLGPAFGRAVALDPADDIVAAITLLPNLPDDDIDAGLRKYTPGGVLVWNEFDPSLRSESPDDIVVDGAGNIYLVGAILEDTFDTDLLVQKYDPDGQLLWEDSVDDSGLAAARGLAINGAGNLVVLGHVDTGGISTNFELWLRVYTPGGAELSTDTLSRADSTQARSLAVDADDNFAIAATETVAVAGTQGLVIKLDATATPVWERSLADVEPHDVALTSDDHIAVVGGDGTDLWAALLRP